MALTTAVRAHPLRVLAAVVAVLVACAAALVLYDRSQREVIAPDVSIGGVPVGGLSRQEAEQRLEQELLPGCASRCASITAPAGGSWGRRRRG